MERHVILLETRARVLALLAMAWDEGADGMWCTEVVHRDQSKGDTG